MLNPTEDFFFNGYTTFPLKDSPVKEKFLNSIKKAKEKDFDQENFLGGQNTLAQKTLERAFLTMTRAL